MPSLGVGRRVAADRGKEHLSARFHQGCHVREELPLEFRQTYNILFPALPGHIRMAADRTPTTDLDAGRVAMIPSGRCSPRGSVASAKGVVVQRADRS